MNQWILNQFHDFNVLTIIVMVTFVTAMSKSNTNRQLKALSEEFYKEFEEIKDEIRGQHQSISDIIRAGRK